MVTMSRPRAQRLSQVGTPNMHEANTDDLRFPFSNFRHSLTLFSKFFSSFLHSTCSLSVSHPYLALDGIYHQLCAAIPSNTTPLHGLQLHKTKRQTGLSPSLIPCSKGFTSGRTKDTHGTTPEGLATWALPASFAITEGILVSFFSSAYLYA